MNDMLIDRNYYRWIKKKRTAKSQSNFFENLARPSLIWFQLVDSDGQPYKGLTLSQSFGCC